MTTQNDALKDFMNMSEADRRKVLDAAIKKQEEEIIPQNPITEFCNDVTNYFLKLIK